MENARDNLRYISMYVRKAKGDDTTTEINELNTTSKETSCTTAQGEFVPLKSRPIFKYDSQQIDELTKYLLKLLQNNTRSGRTMVNSKGEQVIQETTRHQRITFFWCCCRIEIGNTEHSKHTSKGLNESIFPSNKEYTYKDVHIILFMMTHLANTSRIPSDHIIVPMIRIAKSGRGLIEKKSLEQDGKGTCGDLFKMPRWHEGEGMLRKMNDRIIYTDTNVLLNAVKSRLRDARTVLKSILIRGGVNVKIVKLTIRTASSIVRRDMLMKNNPFSQLSHPHGAPSATMVEITMKSIRNLRNKYRISSEQKWPAIEKAVERSFPGYGVEP